MVAKSSKFQLTDTPEVAAYKLSDGTLEQNHTIALRRQAELDFIVWAMHPDNALLGRYEGSSVEVPVLVEWIKANREPILALLRVKDAP